jgi:putative copper export protein
MTYRLLVVLHLLGASVWVGGHLVLSLSVLPRALRARDPAIISEFESGLERLGIPALLVQVRQLLREIRARNHRNSIM